MRLESVSSSYFRNLQGSIEAGAGLNIFFGENGQGKTNYLEAIHILATSRSFRTSRLSEAIRFGESIATIGGRVRQSEGIVRELGVRLENGSRILTVNGKRESLPRYSGELNTVLFNADVLEVVRGQPDARRRFLDSGISSLHPPFIQVFSDFSKIIKQKNAVLQQAKERNAERERTVELLAAWNEQLSALAERIHKARIRFVDRLNGVLEQRLFGAEEISVRYVSSLEGKGDLDNYRALISERLLLRAEAEIYAGYSLIGPQRDELEVLFDGRDIRKFGSAGQQRSAFLLLLLATIEVFNATRGEYPLFLLDDIDAELDYRRIAQLLEYLDGRTQTFVTTSKQSFVERFGTRAVVFGVQSGIAGPVADQVYRPARSAT